MYTYNLMSRKMIDLIGVTIHLYITDVPDIPCITKISTTSTSNETHLPTHEHLNKTLLPQNE